MSLLYNLTLIVQFYDLSFFNPSMFLTNRNTLKLFAFFFSISTMLSFVSNLSKVTYDTTLKLIIVLKISLTSYFILNLGKVTYDSDFSQLSGKVILCWKYFSRNMCTFLFPFMFLYVCSKKIKTHFVHYFLHYHCTIFELKKYTSWIRYR